MSDVADIPNPLVGKGLSSLTMNRSNLTLAAIPVRTCPAHRKRHDGRVGIAGMLCHHLFVPFGSDFIQECLSASSMRMPWGVMSESSLWLSPLCSSGVRTFTVFIGVPVTTGNALAFDFCGAKVVKGADDQIPPCYFACFLPAAFPFSLITRRKRVFRKNARNYWVMRSLSFTLNGTGKIENPDGDASADEGIKKSLHSRSRRKGKISSPSGLRLSR